MALRTCRRAARITLTLKNDPNASIVFRRPDYERDDDHLIVFEYSRTNGENGDISQSNDQWTEEESSGGVIFKKPQTPDNSESPDTVEVLTPITSISRREIKLMYIQMEYCDKQTLTNAIEEGLHQDGQRLWRMFREICEGLVHIHTQGMIHRDLKPVNIFIDSNDHIKIGDFGLATTNILGKRVHVIDHLKNSVNESVDETSDLTGQIGTTLYVAPEINSGRVVHYTQKVDIYSLGIIFFEMCYPLSTGMERVTKITKLRTADIEVPTDSDTILTSIQINIIKWLLNHDPAKRPNSQELLQSDYLPPPQVEETELKEMIRHTLNNPGGKGYRHLVDTAMDQTMSISQDITYDLELSRTSNHKSLRKTLIGQEYVRRLVEQVFRRHGALHVEMTHLMPRSETKIYEKNAPLCEVMTRSGGVVSLPYDLRVPFARSIARAQISHMKRYSISPVYREVRVYGFHPKEQTEIAFDIVSPSEGCLIADAEILYTGDELMREFPSGNESNYFFRLNHNGLLKALLKSFHVPEKHFPDVFQVIREGDRWNKQQRIAHLTTLGITEQNISLLFGIFEQEGSLTKISGNISFLTKRNNDEAGQIKKAMSDLEAIIKHAKSMGIRCNIVVSPSLVYNPNHFSGMVCQLVRKRKKKNEVVAAGGRYDQLVKDFSKLFSLGQCDSKDVCQSAVGISFSMDQLVSFVSGDIDGNFSGIDVVIYSQNHVPTVIKEKTELAAKLWSQGIKTSVSDKAQTLDEIQELGTELGASYLVMMKEGEAFARVRCLENESRFQEKKVSLQDLYDSLCKLIKTDSFGESGSTSIFTRSESVKPSIGETTVVKQFNVQVNYNYRFWEKKSSNSLISRKRLESTISSKINSAIHLLANNTLVEVMALPFQVNVIKSIVSSLDFEDESCFVKSIQPLTDKHPRYRKELRNISEEVQSLRFDQARNVFVLYSTEDHNFEMLIAP